MKLYPTQAVWHVAKVYLLITHWPWLIGQLVIVGLLDESLATKYPRELNANSRSWKTAVLVDSLDGDGASTGGLHRDFKGTWSHQRTDCDHCSGRTVKYKCHQGT